MNNLYVMLFMILSLFVFGCASEERAQAFADGKNIRQIIKLSLNYSIYKLCIDGHNYYFVTGSEGSGGMAPILTDDGKPVHCPMEFK